MIAVDTNVIIRFIVEDDKKQSKQAATFWQHALDNNKRLYISAIVLCEMVWVLESAYGFSRAEIVKTMSLLFHTKGVEIKNKDLAQRALLLYQKNKGDFSDYFILEDALNVGCSHVVTFDKALHKTAYFKAP